MGRNFWWGAEWGWLEDRHGYEAKPLVRDGVGPGGCDGGCGCGGGAGPGGVGRRESCRCAVDAESGSGTNPAEKSGGRADRASFGGGCFGGFGAERRGIGYRTVRAPVRVSGV